MFRKHQVMNMPPTPEHSDASLSLAPRMSLWARLEAFFFTEERPVGLAMVRISLPLVLLIPTLHRVFRVRELYSLAGSPTPLWNNYGQPGFLPIPSAPVAAGLYALLILSLISSSVGWRTRTSLLISGLLIPYFGLVDLISTMTKYTVIATHVLLLLSLSDCGRVWSVDHWFAKRCGLDWKETGPAWPRRLVQILIGVVYLGAAATKLHTPAFFSGDQLRFWLLSNVNTANPLGETLSQYPGLILTMAYVTIVWEILFLFTAWKGTSRTFMLGLGLFFHLMTLFTLGLVVFPLVYFAIYFAWYEQPDQRAWMARWHNWFGHDFRGQFPPPDSLPPARAGWGIPSLLTWTVCAGCAIGLGVWIDHTSDPFGVQRPGGRYALQPISEERLAELLRNDQKVDVTDKVFALDIGSVLFNDNLVDHKTAFRYGEKAMIQCSLLPPHEDLFLEVNLRNEEEQVVRRLWQVVSRENLRGHFWLEMEESLAPGPYSVVIKINGTDAGRRTLELLQDAPDAEAEATVSDRSERTSLPVATTVSPVR
jgi:Vitamin K-dependent gamma-carboxylase